MATFNFASRARADNRLQKIRANYFGAGVNINLSEMNMSEIFALKPYYGLQVYPRLKKGFQYPVSITFIS